MKLIPLISVTSATILLLAGCSITSDPMPVPTDTPTPTQTEGPADPYGEQQKDDAGFLWTFPAPISSYPDECSTPVDVSETVIDELNTKSKTDAKVFTAGAVPLKNGDNLWFIQGSAGDENAGFTVSFLAEGENVNDLHNFTAADAETRSNFDWNLSVTADSGVGKTASDAFTSYAVCFYPLIEDEASPEIVPES